MTNYLDFEIQSALHGFYDSIQIIKTIDFKNNLKEKIINNYIEELFKTIIILKKFIINFTHEHLFIYEDVIDYHDRLKLCLDGLEYLYNESKISKRLKVKVAREIVDIIELIYRLKQYVDSVYLIDGEVIKNSYYLPKKDKRLL